MPERKCNYPPLAKASGNRAPCPDNLYKAFRLKTPIECDKCTKVKGMSRLFAREPSNLGDQIARQIVRDQIFKR